MRILDGYESDEALARSVARADDTTVGEPRRGPVDERAHLPMEIDGKLTVWLCHANIRSESIVSSAPAVDARGHCSIATRAWQASTCAQHAEAPRILVRSVGISR